MQQEMKAFERKKNYELRDVKRDLEERVRSLEFENTRLKKENHTIVAELDAQDSFINNNRTSEEIRRVYDDWDRQIERLENKLKDAEDRYKDLKSEFNELQDANIYMKQCLEEKDDYIHQLESIKPTIQKVYEPVSNPSYTPNKQRDSFEVDNYQRKLKIIEEENEKLREQAFNADKEVERLKENIIIREREIYNIKKSIAINEPNVLSHKSNSFQPDAKNKSKPSDFMLSMESNPNLVNDFAKMTGSSGFKYGQKGPYDESLEKLRKEFSLQQRELGLETLSEMSSSANKDVFKVPSENKAFALMMGQSNLAPTGDIRADYEAVLDENNELKLIVREMRKEMENVVQKMNNSKSNFLTPNGKNNGSNYLDETNLRLLEKQSEIDRLKQEIDRLKFSSPDGNGSYIQVERLEKKLEEKRQVIVKLKGERDNLLELWSEMKIQINSMKKQQDFNSQIVPKDENININNIITQSGRNGHRLEQMNSKSSNLDGVKSRLDSLGENVQELFSEFKSALGQGKRSNSVFGWKKPSVGPKENVMVSGTQCNKLFQKFENIQKQITIEKRGLGSKTRSTSKKSLKRNKNKIKSPIKGIAMNLLERNFVQNKPTKQSF